VVGLFRSRVALQAEILVLRHQLNVLRRKSPRRVALGNIDRVVLIGLYRLAPKVLEALKITAPETVIHALAAANGNAKTKGGLALLEPAPPRLQH
jgi:hypothetical protein